MEIVKMTGDYCSFNCIHFRNNYEGEYDAAMEVLNSIQVLDSRKQQQSKAILTGNRCDIYCGMENIVLAKKEYSDLKTMVNIGETSQKSILDLLKVKINLLEENGSEEDCETVRAALKGNLTPLFQLQLRYLLAQLYEQQGEYRKESKNTFKQEILICAFKKESRRWILLR